MNKDVYIYYRDRIRGPFDPWEIRLNATKAREILVYLGNEVWLPYAEWDKQVPQFQGVPRVPDVPNAYLRYRIALHRYFKRKIFRDHH